MKEPTKKSDWRVELELRLLEKGNACKKCRHEVLNSLPYTGNESCCYYGKKTEEARWGLI